MVREYDEAIEQRKWELKVLERLENEEGNDATSECVCTYLYCE